MADQSVFDRYLKASFRPRHDADLTEAGLARRSLPLVEAFSGRLPLARELADINEHFGVEVAQTVFNLTLERVPAYGEFIRRVRSFELRSFDAAKAGTKKFEITFVATPLPIRGLESSTELLEKWRAYARSFGFTTDVIETDPNAGLRKNAEAISTHLVSNPHPNRILVTYGRSSAEFRILLGMRLGLRGIRAGGWGDDLGELASVRTWINLAGTYNGASYARMMNESFFERLKRKFIKTPDLWAQLDPRLPVWRTPPNFPENLNVINVLGMPFRSDMPQGLMVSQDRIGREVGPNDGVIEVFEAIAHPGLILPINGMSHKIEERKFEPVFKRLLALTASDLTARAELLVHDVREDQRSDDRRI